MCHVSFCSVLFASNGYNRDKKGSAMGQSVLYLADEQKDMIDHYDHPICECGVRLADMVCLKREL